ncbi:MAG: MATE family efflux transporter [Bacteroidales bacterium]|jgi:putative MATE family efflux protein|nr:MATE family efflux transporter [Bacteroidales bacterium]
MQISTSDTPLPSFRKIWNISYPLMIGLIAENLVGVIDTAFLGHVGDLELAASAIAGTFYIILFVVGMGFANGTQILIARRNGEKRLRQIGGIFENSLYFIWFFSAVIILVSLFFSRSILGFMLNSEDILNVAMRYLNIRVFTLFFSLGCVVMRSFFVGIEYTKYIGMAALVVAFTNFVLDYILIFGKIGFPAMGIEGAAWASMLAEVAGFVFFIIIVLRKVDIRTYRMFRFKRPNFHIIVQTMNLSIFTMLQNLFSLSSWFLFFIIIEKTGEQNLAASNIIRSFYILAICPLWAYGATVSTLVSNALGQNQATHVLPIIRRVIRFSVITSLIVYLPVLVSARGIMSLYTDSAYLVEIGFKSFYVVGFAIILSGFAWIIFSAISATGNTMIALFVEGITLVLYLIAVYMLSSHFPHNLEYIWSGEIVYQILLGLLSVWYFSGTHWQKKKI